MKAPILIDCDYVYPEFAAAYLLVEGKSAAFVENNTTHAVPRLLAALQKQGLQPQDVQYVIVTHVHLDHAGGSSALMQACPNATLIAHPRATGHLIDPTRLVASARKVYGNAEFDRLYGQIDPIQANRVRSMEDGESLYLGNRELSFLHTRGHANHHFCVVDASSGGVFTGDTFGVAYPVLQKQGLFIFPSTSPTDFDPEEARRSIRKILELQLPRAYLTHFGELTDLSSAAAQLLRYLDFSENLLESVEQKKLPDAQIVDFCLNELDLFFRPHLTSDKIRDLLRIDIQLNAAGLAYSFIKKKAKSSGTK